MEMNTEAAFAVPDHLVKPVLQKVQGFLRPGARRVDWEEVARRLAPLFRQVQLTVTGPELARWVNAGLQRKRLPDWFVREWNAWRRNQPVEETVEPMVEPANPEPSTSVERTETVMGWPLAVVGGEHLIEDEELGRRLGYADPVKVRALIERIWPDETNRPRRVIVPTRAGGKPRKPYLLNERECTKVALRSETPTADKVQDEVIEVFLAVRHGKTPPASASPAMPPEWTRGLFESADRRIREVDERAASAQANASAAAERASEAEDKADRAVQDAADAKKDAAEAKRIAIHRAAASAPPAPIPIDWRTDALIAEQFGLPWLGTGKKTVPALAESAAITPEHRRYVSANGRRAWAMSPEAVKRLEPALIAARRSMQEHAYVLTGAVMKPRTDIKPVRSAGFVAAAMLTAGAGESSPQAPLPFEQPRLKVAK